MRQTSLVDADSVASSWAALEAQVESELGVLEPGSVTAFAVAPDQAGVALQLDAALLRQLKPDFLAAEVHELAAAALGAQRIWVILQAVSAEPVASTAEVRREAWAQRLREGKLPHGALAYLDGLRQSAADAEAEDAPASQLEAELAAVWREVLPAGALPAHDASFFALGGSSLAAAQMLLRVQQQFGVALTPEVLFEAPTLRELARLIGEAQASGQGAIQPVSVLARDQRLPLSAAQRRMHFLWQLDRDGAAYNICGALRFSGVLNVEALQRALDALAQRHEALRTRFPEHAGQPYQHIDAPRAVWLRRDDLQLREPEARERAARELLCAEAARPFDLERGPLFRTRLIRLRASEHWLVVTLHHSIGDGASVNVLVAELTALYVAYASPGARTADLPDLPIQYADYAAWQAERLAAGERARQLEYFRAQLPAATGPLPLPSDRPRPASQSFRGARYAFRLPEALVAGLRALARQHDASLFMLLMAAFQLLLRRYTQTSEFCVGVVADNRVCREARGIVGPCVNTQALCARVRDDESFAELLARVKRAVVSGLAHQDLPFEELVEALAPERSAAYNPLFQVMFNHQPRDLRALAAWPALTVEALEVPETSTRFDLSLNTEEDAQGQLSAAFVYSTDLFEAERIERMAAHFQVLLDAIVRAPASTRVDALPFIPAQELARIEQASVPAAFSPRPGFVPAWIRERAALQPDACALSFGEQTLSYGELALRVQLLAQRLTAAGAGPDVIVALLLPRSLELAIAVLATLEAGAAYLPLDTEYPPERLAYMRQDAGARIVITTREARASLPAAADSVIELDDFDWSLPVSTWRAPALHPHHLAYVLYTSGSTGRPKAVGNTHGALAERLSWMQHEYALDVGECLLHKTPLTFDVAVWELLWPLCNGARLVIAPPGEHRDPQALARLVQAHGVSTIHFVPSLLREFVATPEAAGCRSLTRLFSGGEALTPELCASVRATLPWVRLDNRYGPTEALINASYYTCPATAEAAVPIGRPIPNTSLRILDDNLRPVPVGVPGELYIGGSCLARGYLARSALTAERFVPDPFAAVPGQRLYRSGDFARLRADGAIEYLGRRDHQVKIRGVRVELGELEAALLQSDGVSAAAAVACQGPAGDARLVGYVVADAALDLSALQRSLERRLSPQLVPAQLVRLDSLPLLPSGKLDRKALPAPVWQTRAYVAPGTLVERKLAAIWAELLGVDRVGLEDDFFALGGHSLLATQVVSRARAAFDIELPLRELFDARELGAFSARVQAAVHAGRRSRQLQLTRVDRGARLPLSYAQERMWFLWRLEPESAAYHVGGGVELAGLLNVDALAAGLCELVARHEGLRTTFPMVDGAPVQRIADSAAIALQHTDLSGLPAAARDGELQRVADAEAHLPFDLEVGPLLRARLVKLEPERHVLLITLHHIVAEGWAMDIFAREYAALYEAFCRGQASPLPPLGVQYVDYAAWQRSWLDSGEAERQLAYWRRALGDEHPVLALPSDRPRPPIRSERGDYHRFSVEAALTRELQAFGVQHGVTLSMTLMAALSALLYRYTGERDQRIGYPIANRIRPEFEGLIGAFLNTQVLRCDVSDDLRVDELVARVKHASLEAQSHQDVPFHRIVEAVAPERSAAHSPLFQVMCNVQRWQFQQRRELMDLKLSFLPNDARAAQFDLALDVSEVGDELECALSYSLDLFEPETAQRIAAAFVRLLQSMVAERAEPARVGELLLLAPGEEVQALALAHGERSALPEANLQQLFERQVAQSPHAPAVVYGEQRLSYAELNARANGWAARLRALGVGPDVRVGLCAERSIELVVALLGVLKAGGAYVPLDPEYPPQRLAFMIRDSGIGVIVHDERFRALLPASGLERVALQDEPPARADNPEASAHPEHLAYCLFTSGSTGEPKAVAVPQRGIVNRLAFMQREYALTAADRVLFKTPLSFDVSSGEILWPLLHGAQLVIAPPSAHRDPAELCAVIARHAVTAVDFVPPLLQAFIASGSLAACPSLRLVTVGGEAMPPELPQQFSAQHRAALYNLYGPTEASVEVAYHRCDGASASGRVPIGRPLTNTALYVLDARMQPVPLGVTGELYIGGASLARGYLGRAAATAARFVPDPFAAEPGARLYRTGDLARYRADGVLEYIGRGDEQVKVRGYRIELAEIEAALRAHPAVRAVAVSVRAAQAGKQLVAYVVAAHSGDAALDEEALRSALRAHLQRSVPDYMLPHRIAFLAALPLLPSGKLDRRALPDPGEQDMPSEQFVAPAPGLEQTLAEIWCEVLGLPRVSAEANFFELGGDSIVSLQVVHRARQRGLPLAPKELFARQTIRALANALAGRELSGAPSRREQVPAVGEVPLTPIQRVFLAHAGAPADHYNQAVLLEPKRALSPEVLRRALAQVASHHDALRLRFVRESDGAYRQFYADAPADDVLWVEEVDRLEAIEPACERAQRSLDLQRGPIHRALLLQLPDGAQRLALVVHHLAVDGVSFRVLVADLQAAYQQLEAADSCRLPPPSSPFKAWAQRLSAWAQSAELSAELGFWCGLAQMGEHAARELPPDHAAGSMRVADRERQMIRLDVATTSALLRSAPAAYRTQVNELLLCALARTLCPACGSRSVWIELEGHGRDDRFEDVDVSRTLGWFTSLFPVLLEPSGEAASLGASIRAVKEQLRAIPNGGLGFSVLRELGPADVRAQLETVPRPAITFNYLGQLDTDTQASLFALAGEGSGSNHAEHLTLDNALAIDAHVAAGQLTLVWTYSGAQYRSERIAQLAAAYRAELQALIAHCASGAAHGVTPSDFPLAALSQADLDALPVSPEHIEDIYPLSPLQQGIVFHSLFDAEAGLYVSQLAVDVTGLDCARLRALWQAAIDRHEVLRTSFHALSDGRFVQLVHKRAELSLRELDALGADAEALAQLAAQERARTFALHEPKLSQLVCVNLGEGRTHLIWTYHHVLLDGWSSVQLLAEVLRGYAGEPIAAPGARYAQYIAWLQARDRAADERYFRQRLGALVEPTSLCAALARQERESGAFVHELSFSAARAERFSRFASEQRVTLNTLVQAAWVLLLQRYTGQRTVAFGATVSGRPASLPSVETLLGLFINTVPVIQAPAPAQPLGAWLRQLQDDNLTLAAYEHAPLSEIQRWAGRPGQPLFDTLVVFENYPLDRALRERDGGGLSFGRVASVDSTHLPLVLEVSTQSELVFRFKGSGAHIDAARLPVLAAQLSQLLDAMLLAPEQPVGRLSLITADERARLMTLAHGPARAADARRLPRRIAAQAAATPDAIAVECEGARLTYAELNARANQLARYLRAQGIGPDVLVSVCLERSTQLVVSLLAVLKAGGAYVPLDPSYPSERLGYMLADSGAAWLLTEERLVPRLPPSAARVFAVDREWDQVSAYERTDLGCELHDHHLAYCIYTSGSTGRPKGVQLSHAGLNLYLDWALPAYGVAALEGSALHSSIAFDLTITSLWLPLCAGKRVTLTPERGDALEGLAEVLRQTQGAGLLKLTPSHAAALAATDLPELPEARALVVGGEALTWECIASIARWAPHGRVINEYGPTETVVGCCVYEAPRDPAAQAADSVPIGVPIDNTQLYVLDDTLALTPPGVAGELYIGGSALARGYRNQPGLTAERFVPNPFPQHAGERLYRTGDLVRHRSDGLLEYLGRIDHQVKIRGYRIELGEIEARLREHERVQDAVVVARDAGSGKRLIGYVVSEADGGELEDELRAQLGRVLPDYMVPSRVLRVPEWPLTPNGKLDRAALPAPEAVAHADYTEPETDAERTLARIWCALLRVERVGRHDNFFALGGDSILSLQLVAAARREGLALGARDVFEHQSLAAIAAAASAAVPENAAERELSPVLSPAQRALLETLPAGEIEDAYPLSPMQQGMLFHARLHPESAVYVNQLRMRVDGLDVARLRDAWEVVSARHEILRTSFLVRGEEQLQLVHRQLPSAVDELDFGDPRWTERQLAELARSERARGFDLQEAPLTRILLVRTGEHSHELIWTHHHILMDGWSHARVLEELIACYLGETLPPQRGKYRDYIGWLQRQDPAQSERFWTEELRALDEPTLLATAAMSGAQLEPGQGYGQLVTRLDAAETEQLRRFAQRERVTLNTLVQAAWVVLLQRYLGQRTVAFGSTVAGRPTELPGAEGWIGLFINTLPVVQSPSPERLVAEFLRELQRDNARLREHEHAPLYEIQRWSGRAGQALFDTLLVFENYPVDQALRARSQSELTFSAIETAGETSWPLTIGVYAGEQLELAYEFDRSHFDAASVQALASHLRHLLVSLPQAASRPLGTLSILTAVGERALTTRWNPERASFGTHDALRTLLQQQLDEQPDAPALISGETRLSYRELALRARGLAAQLRELGVGPEVVVGVHLARSAEAVIALIGVLEAGGAFVVLDPQLPADRLAHMLDDAAPAVIVTDSRTPQPALPPHCACVELDRLELPAGHVPDVPLKAAGHHLAYLIYTSGSTGQPKAVAVTRGDLSMHVRAIAEIYGYSPRDAALHMAAFSFDAAIEQLFVPLLSGSRVVIGMAHEWSTAELRDVVEREQVTVIYPPTTPIVELAAHVLRSGKPLPLRICCVGGEAVPRDAVESIQAAFGCRVINGYGPTETVVTPLLWVADAAVRSTYAPIGRAVGDRVIYVLDQDLNIVPSGVTGELYIGGAGVARSYHKQPALTARSFVPDRFSGSGGRLYRTGDLVRSREDGTIEYVGRADQQVKIRGHRVELGEIETRLRAHPDVSDAVVLAEQGPNGKQLVGYVVTSAGSVPEDLRPTLRQTLPAYMIPARLVPVSSIPLTRHGKVDRRALSALRVVAPEGSAGERQDASDYVAPQTELARELARAWREVLEIERVSMTDNFFELGGQSLLALRVIERLESALQIRVPLRWLFEAESLADFERVIRERGEWFADTGE